MIFSVREPGGNQSRAIGISIPSAVVWGESLPAAHRVLIEALPRLVADSGFQPGRGQLEH